MRANLKKFLLCTSIIGLLILILFSGNWIGTWYFKLDYKAPYLSITTGNASTCIGISFETPVPCVAGVYIGTDTTYSVVNDTDTIAVNLHHFNFTTLSPGTIYHYIINTSTPGASTNYMNRDFTFRTAPLASDPHFTVGILGDNRPDTFGRSGQEVTMLELVRQNPDFVINVGDIVMTAVRLDQWARLFQTMTMNGYASTHPYMISIGNHETMEYGLDQGRMFDRYFYYPHKNLYYAYNYSNTCFISLDLVINSFLNPHKDGIGWVSDEQITWLNETLREANASSEINWIIASWHVPAYSSNGDNNVIKQRVMPLLELYEVDLILCGHHHYYERLLVNGITHVISGGGGAEPDPFVSNISPYSVVIRTGFQYCMLEINNQTLSLSAYNLYGVVFDSFTIEQDNPWRL